MPRAPWDDADTHDVTKAVAIAVIGAALIECVQWGLRRLFADVDGKRESADD